MSESLCVECLTILLSSYIEQLIERGYKVAICEQTEDPKQAKGVVRREVVQLITPGTMMEGKGLSEKENNYIATITHFEDGRSPSLIRIYQQVRIR